MDDVIYKSFEYKDNDSFEKAYLQAVEAMREGFKIIKRNNINLEKTLSKKEQFEIAINHHKESVRFYEEELRKLKTDYTSKIFKTD